MSGKSEISGYMNADGKFGIRKHVAVVSLSVFSNVATQSISNLVDGTVPLIHPHGRAEIGMNKKNLETNLIGQILNPNVQSALVVGYEQKTTEKYLTTLSTLTKKRVESLVVLEGGSISAIAEGTRKAMELSIEASEVRRETIGFEDITLGIKCGSTDATSGIASNPAVGSAVDRVINLGGTAIFSETTELMGAEQVLTKRAVNDTVAKKIYEIVKQNEMFAKQQGVDLLGINPVPDNIEGGISTIEEKSLGAILKGGTSTIMDVLKYGEHPPAKGLYIMDSPSAAQEVLTALTSAGCQAIFFSTGLGNPSGTPLVPVIKVTGNMKTVKKMRDHIDVDVSDIISNNLSYNEAGKKVFDHLAAVINGGKTRAEVLKHREFSPIPVGL